MKPHADCIFVYAISIFKSGVSNFHVLVEDVAVSVAELDANAFVIQAVRI